ncbi:MAG: hypothetical protein L0Y42_10815 [Phycisphaerales bacterium]|nr:hypothetical protein [Phycisphaerales bacterium]
MDEAKYMVRLSNGQEFGPASMELIEQWAREGRVPVDGLLAPLDGVGMGAGVRSVMAEPKLRAILQAPPTVSTGLRQPAGVPEGGAMSGMIPYKNPPALVGYYLAIFSLLPMVGIVLGIPAVILGIIGLRKRMKEPAARGMAHAWIAIILGAMTTLAWGAWIVGMLVAASRW